MVVCHCFTLDGDDALRTVFPFNVGSEPLSSLCSHQKSVPRPLDYPAISDTTNLTGILLSDKALNALVF